jgi:integrase
VQKIFLTDKYLSALPNAESGKRYVVNDTKTIPLAVRVTERGVKSFIVVKRPAGSDTPCTVVIGRWPETGLKVARDAVSGVLATLARGTTPAQERERRQKEDARLKADSFDAAVGSFIEDLKSRDLRRWKEVAATLRRDFLGQEPTNDCRVHEGRREWVVEWANGPQAIWRGKAISSINRSTIVSRIDAIKRERGVYPAMHALKAIRRLFGWTAEGRFGMETNPTTGIRIKALGINVAIRQRVLSPDELVRVWRAAGQMTHPWREFIWMLMLTGQRLNDIAGAQRGEVVDGLLIIPPERYKSGSSHMLPMTTRVQSILDSLPVHTAGPYLFSTTHGARSISGFSKMKSALDAALAADGGTAVAPFIIHDIRRSLRTNLSTLGVDHFVAERVIGHAMPGVSGVYDVGAHIDQKRAALQRHEDWLLSLVEPREPISNVVQIGAARF